MRGAYAAAIGGPDPIDNLEIGDVSDPEMRSGEALVRVASGSLNHHDLWTLQGIASRPVVPPQVLGCDATGVVEGYAGDIPGDVPKVGTRVVVHGVLSCRECKRCKEGRTHLCRKVAILSEPGYPGALAEILAVPAANLVGLPDTVDFDTAACLPTAYLTANHALFSRGGLRAGDTVLIHGASGGVSTAAMLLAQTAGIRVLVTSRSKEKGDVAVATGLAAAAFPSDETALGDIMDATDGEGVDAVIDSVGKATWALSLRSLRPGGTLAVVGTTSGPNPQTELNRIFWRHLTIAGSSMGTREELEKLVRLCAAGDLKPLIDSVMSLDETGSGLRRLAEGRTLGKLVIRVT